MVESGSTRPPAENWSCGYEPERGNWACLQAAAWHGFRLTNDGTAIASMMAACDEHKARMARTADYLHTMTHPCAIPGSRFRWPENECYTEWEDSELTVGALAEMTS